jgi:hypothetical protein
MSRASWYRHGKPETKPAKRPTMKQQAQELGLKLRTLQRARRVFNAAQVLPEIDERIQAGELTLHGAERYIRWCIKVALEDKRSVIHLPDLSKAG